MRASPVRACGRKPWIIEHPSKTCLITRVRRAGRLRDAGLGLPFHMRVLQNLRARSQRSELATPARPSRASPAGGNLDSEQSCPHVIARTAESWTATLKSPAATQPANALRSLQTLSNYQRAVFALYSAANASAKQWP